MENKYIYGIEVHVEGKVWHLRDEVYTEDEKELLEKNIAYSRKQLPEDKFRVVKYRKIQEASPDSSNRLKPVVSSGQRL